MQETSNCPTQTQIQIQVNFGIAGQGYVPIILKSIVVCNRTMVVEGQMYMMSKIVMYEQLGANDIFSDVIETLELFT